MPDIKVSGLTAVTTVNDIDELPIIQGGVSNKVAVGRLNKSLINGSISAQSPAAATHTYLIGSDVTIPTGVSITTTTVFQWKLVMSKTAAGSAARTFFIRAGTAGTIADTALITFTTGAGTAAIDTGRLDVLLTVRSVGASGILQASSTMSHSLASTGFLAIPSQTLSVTSSAFNTTTAGLKFGMSFTSGASELVTFSQVTAEAYSV